MKGSYLDSWLTMRNKALRKKTQVIKNQIQMREKMRLTAVMRMGKIIPKMTQMTHRINEIMNVFIPLYLYQRDVKVSGLKVLITSIYHPPFLASHLSI